MPLDILTLEPGSSRVLRDTGTYVASSWGWVSWQVQGGTASWRERGGHLWLMNGRTTLAYAEYSCKRDAWEEISESAVRDIEPWVRVLRVLAPLEEKEKAVQTALWDGNAAQEAALSWTGWEDEGETQSGDWLMATATPEEVQQATVAEGPGLPPVSTRLDWPRLGTIVADRLRYEISQSQGVAMMARPTAPLDLIGWEHGPFDTMLREENTPRQRTLQRYIIRHLLRGWAAACDQRGPLIEIAQAARLSKSEIQRLSGVARTTIRRSAG